MTASIDKFIKVWHMPSGPTGKNIKLVAQFKSENELMHLKYSAELKVLAFLDSQCSLGSVYLSDNLSRGQQSSSSAAARDDIDLDEIDAAMNEENE